MGKETGEKRMKAGPVEALLAPYAYLDKVPGKGVRANVLKAFNEWFQVKEDALYRVIDIVHKLHTSSLLIDDVEDDAEMRRGQKAAHLVYGAPWVVNTANLVYFQVLQDILQLDDPSKVDVYAEEMVKLHYGQGYDIYWRDQHICPSIEEYMDMVRCKTGGLFRMAVRLLMDGEYAKEKEVLRVVDILGMYFQVRDDYVNLCSVSYAKKNGFCQDLSEGKYSFLIAHGMAHDKEGRLEEIVRARPSDVETKVEALQIMRAAGSFTRAEDVMKGWEEEIRIGIEGLGGNQPLWYIVQRLQVREADKFPFDREGVRRAVGV